MTCRESLTSLVVDEACPGDFPWMSSVSYSALTQLTGDKDIWLAKNLCHISVFKHVEQQDGRGTGKLRFTW